MPKKNFPCGVLVPQWGWIVIIFVLFANTIKAGNDFDLGKVKVVGKNAQKEEFQPKNSEIQFEMGEKAQTMPDLPEIKSFESSPLTEKPFEPLTPQNTLTKRLTLQIGQGTRDAFEAKIYGSGSYNGYEGKLDISRTSRDGFKSTVDDKKNVVAASLKSFGDGKYELKLNGEFGSEDYAQRGTRSNPTPFAGIEDRFRVFTISANTTTKEGAFVAGNVTFESRDRTTTNPAGAFKEDGKYYLGVFHGEYLINLHKKFSGKLELDLTKNSYSIDKGPESENTKRVLALTGQYDFQGKALLEFGCKSMGLMGKERFSPIFRFDYHWAKPWQAILAYDEDLRNNDLREVFLPKRYVSFNNLRASHKRRLSGKLNYRWEDGNTFSVEVFREKEDDAIEYSDRYDVAKKLLVSDFKFATEAERTGISIGGHVKLDENFSLGAATIFQNPTDKSTGLQLGYEPKRILDVLFSYRNGAFEADYTRKAFFDRVAYVPATQVDPGDYSRADLFCKYHFNKKYRAVLKIKDLYDDKKSIRYNVPEEGRVSILGLEADF